VKALDKIGEYYVTHHTLVCHPTTPSRCVRGVEFSISYLPGERILLRWKVAGAQGLVVPEFAGASRADNLWTTTCFEWFLIGDGTPYREFNFSPSQRWSAYGFDRYREGQHTADVAEAPEITTARGDDIFTLNANLPFSVLFGARAGGVSAVIEETGGVKSYWALRHGGERPDFHDAASFIQIV